MANIIIRPDWYIPESQVTPEKMFNNRRRFLRQLGMGGLLAAALGAEAKAAGYPYTRNPDYNPKVDLSEEKIVSHYNNFYEFTTNKPAVWRMMEAFKIDPWTVTVGGLVEKPLKLDVKELIAMMPLEERVYRFRCVEAWAMVVPWTGFQFSKLVEKVQPKPEAKFVKFVSFNQPEQAPGMYNTNYPWPYTEGLRLEEAMHPLTLGGTGLYGKPMPKQNGAPLRMVVPWKYGYKSIKSIVKIEFTDKQPKTLWESMAPDEYPFESNVNPAIPHPRWSQATERMIDSGDRVRTQPYNGYAAQVSSLYKS